MLSTLRPLSVLHKAARDRGKLVTLIAGKGRRLLFAGDGRRMTRSFNVTPKKTEQNLIVRSGKSEAEITNTKRPRTRYCNVKAKYTDMEHRAASL